MNRSSEFLQTKSYFERNRISDGHFEQTIQKKLTGWKQIDGTLHQLDDCQKRMPQRGRAQHGDEFGSDQIWTVMGNRKWRQAVFWPQ
uniref:Uncharacterized protein n=1 Tax=Syphacia muris TaxID=451379 RepID=A0A0N5AZ96_9BILA